MLVITHDYILSFATEDQDKKSLILDKDEREVKIGRDEDGLGWDGMVSLIAEDDDGNL